MSSKTAAMKESYPFPSFQRRRRRNRTLLVIGIILAAAALFWAGKTFAYDRRSLCSGADTGSSCVEVYGNPTITRAAPTSGDISGNAEIMISGTRFGPGVQVWFGDTPAARVSVRNYQQLVAIAPRAQWPGAVDISVARGNGPRSRLQSAYRYTSYLSITSVSSSSGSIAGGTAITIIGSGFAPDTRVYFGETRALRVTYGDQNTLRVLAPRHAIGTVDIRVSAARQAATKKSAYTYQ
jgi:hypothetical protein